MKKIAVLDIGGTSIKSGIWDGELWEEREVDTNAKNGGKYVIERVKEIIHSYSEFCVIGISTAGQVNPDKGYISFANENIPGYTGMQLKKILEEEFSVPVAVENDVNAAAIGELRFGAGRGQENFLCITYGTGVGGAIVVNGNIYTGSNFSAGEFGGILIHPEERTKDSYFSGCYERYASVSALVECAKIFDKDLDSGRKIFSRIDEIQVRAIIDHWIGEIVYGLISLIHIFNPSCVILGGGIMVQPYILEQVRTRIYNEVMDNFKNVNICQAKLGNRAGLLGAAYLASLLIRDEV